MYTLAHAFPKGRPHEESPAGRGDLARRPAARRPGAGSAGPRGARRPPVRRASPVGSKIWVGRYAEFEEFLRTATIERVTTFPSA